LSYLQSLGLCIELELNALFRRSWLKNTNGNATKKLLRRAAASHSISLFISFPGILPSSEMYISAKRQSICFWSCNGAYACGYLVPWCSPIGLRALVANQPFYADLELSQVNGTLCPRRSAYTPTLNSRLASLWRHISKSRTEFETKPDTGFMGKGLTRQLNRAWNYGFKGLLCSLLFLLIFPVICVLCSAGGICLALSAPVWAPVFALIYQVCIILVWDVDNPDPKRGPLLPMIRVLVRDLLLDGLLQPIACLVTAFIVCPVISLLLAVCKSGSQIITSFSTSFLFMKLSAFHNLLYRWYASLDDGSFSRRYYL